MTQLVQHLTQIQLFFITLDVDLDFCSVTHPSITPTRAVVRDCCCWYYGIAQPQRSLVWDTRRSSYCSTSLPQRRIVLSLTESRGQKTGMGRSQSSVLWSCCWAPGSTSHPSLDHDGGRCPPPILLAPAVHVCPPGDNFNLPANRLRPSPS